MNNKAQEILDFINFTLKNDGYSPSVREICEAVNLRLQAEQFLLLRIEVPSLFLRESTTEVSSNWQNGHTIYGIL